MKKFENKTVLVTGSSRGIGAAIARGFAAEGATVIVNYVQNQGAAEETVASCIERGGEAWAIQADVTSESDVIRMMEEIELEVGNIDVVVNNAFKPYVFNPDTRKMFSQLTWGDYQDQIDGAVKSTYYVCQQAIPLMKKQTKGSIVNMVTNLVERPLIPYHDYTTAKSALIGFSRNLAVELGAFGIRVNCIAPGLVYPTDASRQTREEIKEMIIAQTPLRRIAQPEDIVGPVLFLSSEWSQFVTGQTLYVDGGLVMS
ncbi:SDR family oxidoreductase [Neobacillus niacini]|uniref:SDR family oxidoreductase n=1 Tax=Neobacillus niacini TaxID=86668 RepID=UPI00052F5AC3|nr:SDR family oxidoreductase [Neobacillus niacini]KGM44766.1 3-oxoacyl-ACP reductase [Neobacillus niacini]MEC1525475.1 SDR family oxidoreductase [Neobacillus niacini]